MNPFEKVLDSSVWHDQDNLSAVNRKDPYVRIGTVLKTADDEEAGETRYLVEVRDKNDIIISWCRPMSRFGGAYNYEDYTVRGYTSSPLTSLADFFSAKAGDFVLVAYLNGETREGVILGGLKHPSRKSELKADNGPAYTSEFNGIETKITPEGEYTLTFKGIPVNQSLLTAPAALPILPPIYNPVISGSYVKFDSTGSWEVNDSALALPQSIKIDKSGGSIAITSGQTSMTLSKLPGSIDIATNQTTIDSKLKMDISTLQFKVDATASIKLKALKVAIGSDGVELFDQLIQLIDALGTVTAISPVGPCTPLMATPQWTQLLLIKAKLMVVKGSL